MEITAVEAKTWLHAFGIEADSLEVVRRLPGGTQNELLLLRVGETEAVLRRGPADKEESNAKVLAREARTLSALRASNVPHPRLLASCLDEAAIGTPFLLMEYKDGFNATLEVPSEIVQRPELHSTPASELVRAVGLLANVDYRATELAATAQPDSWLERQVERWSTRVEAYKNHKKWHDTGRIAQAIAIWRQEHYPKHRMDGIVHGDFHFGNFLFNRTDATLSAIVDWELATIGDPRLDFGHLLATWPKPADPRRTGLAKELQGLPDRARLIELHRTHNPHLAEDLKWFYVLACFRLATILEDSWFRALEGRIAAHIGERLHGIAESLYEDANQTLESGDLL